MKLDEKQRLENRCVKLIISKKMILFSKLIKALKISKTKFYKFELNKSEKILNAIAEIKRISAPENKTEFKTPEEVPKIVREKVLKNTSEENPTRSFSEIEAKLFVFKSYKAKKYNNLTESAKKLLDRQIWLLEWVLKINTEEDK